MPEFNEQIKTLEEELRKTSYNKRTQHHIGLIKAKIARLREREETRSSKGGKKDGYAVRKTGDATVALIGFPSVGKSTLLNALTNAESKTASYAFTTLTCIPGLMQYRNAKIQILDLPGIVKGAASGVGRGKEVLAVLRTADALLMLVDVLEQTHFEVLMKEVYNAGLRVNQQTLDVKIKKTEKGGVSVASTVKLKHLTKETVKGILREFKLVNAQVVIREDITVDQLIDAIEGNKHYLPMLLLVNKIDNATTALLQKIKKKWPEALLISAQEKRGIEKVKLSLFQKLELMRIYLKEVGKEADMEEPLIIHQNSSIRDVCNKLHRDFVEKFRFAKVWGQSAKFGGQKLALSHKLKDKDVLQIFLR